VSESLGGSVCFHACVVKQLCPRQHCAIFSNDACMRTRCYWLQGQPDAADAERNLLAWATSLCFFCFLLSFKAKQKLRRRPKPLCPSNNKKKRCVHKLYRAVLVIHVRQTFFTVSYRYFFISYACFVLPSLVVTHVMRDKAWGKQSRDSS